MCRIKYLCTILFICQELSTVPAPHCQIPGDHVRTQNGSGEPNVPGLDKEIAVLESIFKHSSFRGKQREVIGNIKEGKNCLVVLPTGGGKTICYSIPVLVSGGVAIVICPLLSLMMDQVQFLRAKGLNVCYLNATVPQEDKDIILHNLLSDQPPYSFFFVTPESATQPDMLQVFSRMKIKGTLKYFVIDECHCIDTWGHDFRPAYGNLGILSSLECQIVALTATSTTKTEQTILSSLNMPNATVIRQ